MRVNLPRRALSAPAYLVVATVVVEGLASTAVAQELIQNGTFETDLAGWQLAGPPQYYSVVDFSGHRAVKITNPIDDAAFLMLHQEVAVSPGDILQARVTARQENQGGDKLGVYATLEFYDAGATATGPAAFSQSFHAGGEWTDLLIRSAAPQLSTTARLVLVLYGLGDGYFDDVSLQLLGSTNVAPLQNPVTITVSDEVVVDSLVGFGVEDDGLFYTQLNASMGVTASDVADHVARINWLAPDTVRMFFRFKDWCPTEDWTTFQFEDASGSADMESHYRTLEIYQQMGATVNVVGVETGMSNTLLDGSPTQVAYAIGGLLEYLVVTKGFTVVREFTLNNEPNGAYRRRGNVVDAFMNLTEVVAAEIASRDLDIEVIGSDDVNGLPWFERSIRDASYYATVGKLASHLYLLDRDRTLAPYFFDDRLALIKAQATQRPFVITEFGFRDARSNVVQNPVMSEYAYALWVTEFSIEGLNHGVAGLSQFSAGALYYPGPPPTLMDYALWDFKTPNAWKVRPVYHAWANLLRHTSPGDAVRRVDSSQPAHVKAASVADTLFWVNLSDDSATVQIAGFSAAEVQIMTEATLSGDRETGVQSPVVGDQFQAPPRSFGYLVRQTPPGEVAASEGCAGCAASLDRSVGWLGWFAWVWFAPRPRTRRRQAKTSIAQETRRRPMLHNPERIGQL